MRQNILEIEDGKKSFALQFSDRDFEILGGPTPFMELGAEFVRTLGVFENTNVSMDMKIPPGSSVRRSRQNLAVLAKGLLKLIQRDHDLLSFDYSFRLTKSDEKHRIKRQLSGFRIRSLYGCVDGWPRGFCTLTLNEVSPIGIGRTVEIIDLRNSTELETDDMGLLKVYKQEADLNWTKALQGLIDFLNQSTEKEVTIHHS
jgi:hypothetical protein